MSLVLVVDDEPAILRTLSVNLGAHGFDVETVSTGEEALKVAANRPPDLVIVDLGLPGIDGIEVIRALREWTSIPVIVLSVREQETQKVAALEVGADDYVTKPFGVAELIARVRAALRRSVTGEIGSLIVTPHFSVDLSAKKAERDGDEIHLTPTEWGIVEVLVLHPGKLVTQAEILHSVWGPNYEEHTNYLRLFMSRIRKKLEPDPSDPQYFITEPGMGYRFESTGA